MGGNLFSARDRGEWSGLHPCCRVKELPVIMGARASVVAAEKRCILGAVSSKSVSAWVVLVTVC